MPARSCSRSTIRAQKFTQPNQSGEFRYDAVDDDIPDPLADGKAAIAPATPGWFIQPSDVSFCVTWAVGDWADCGNRSNPTNAIWNVKAVHHHGWPAPGTSGQVHFVLKWTEYQYRSVDIPAEQVSKLEWGASRIFEVPAAGTWTAKYVDFRGKSFDIGSAAFTNPYIQVITSGNSVIIATVP